MQKYSRSIYTCSCRSGDWGTKQKACFSKWRKRELHSHPPDVKQSTPLLVTERMSSFCLSKRWDQRVSSTGIISWWGATTLRTMQPPCYPSGKNNLSLEHHPSPISTYCTLKIHFNNSPCIQNQRNPGLLCHLWKRLWNQEGHPGAARRNLCSLVVLGLRGDPWSLGHGNLLCLECVSVECRMSQNSFVSLLPRSTFAP